jgi:hypothetical protein
MWNMKMSQNAESRGKVTVGMWAQDTK